MTLAPIVSTQHPQLCKRSKIEKEFFQSLGHICQFYHLQVVRNPALIFPMNIMAAYQELSVKLSDRNDKLKLAIIQDETHMATLATAKSFDTRTTLYYIPCEPVFLFMEDASKKTLAELCLSVFSYLFLVVEIPHHRQWSSYLFYMYDMIGQWMNEDDGFQEEERDVDLQELDENYGRGDFVLHRMQDRQHLLPFEQRVKDFQPSDNAELDFQQTAIKAFTLYRDYPERSVMEGIHPELIEEDEYSNGRVSADKYLSFLWSFNDSIYDTLEDTINCDLQECSHIDEPFAMQVFDRLPNAEEHDFDFETRLFNLLDCLVCNLRDLQFNKSITNSLSA